MKFDFSALFAAVGVALAFTFAAPVQAQTATRTSQPSRVAKVAQAPRPTSQTPAQAAPKAAQSSTAAAPAPTPKAAQPSAAGEKLTAEDEAKFKAAVEHFNNQDVPAALAALQEIAAANPKAIPPRLILARWFTELQNPRAARLSLEAATAESPNDPEAFLTLAEAALVEGSTTAAELLAERGGEILAKYDANPERKKNLTRKMLTVKLGCANARQNWNGAQETILALIKLDGETPELDRALGRALFHQKQEAKAREILLRADKAGNGEGLPADAILAQLYAERGDLAAAKASLADALKLNPKSPAVLALSITTALEENDLDGAWNLAQKLYAEDKSPDVLKVYGNVCLFRADYAGAEAAFQEAVRQNSLDADAIGGLALALCEQDDADKRARAIQYAASNLQRQANNRDCLGILGWAQYKSGDLDAALNTLQQSVADGRLNAATAYYLAVVLNDKGNADAARQLLDAALASRPPFAKRAAAAALRKKLG